MAARSLVEANKAASGPTMDPGETNYGCPL